MGVLVVAEGRTWFFRTALFIGLVSVVATIIYLTPVPDRYPQSCSRPCHELDWPMICRVKLTLEPYQTFSNACGDCPGNVSSCFTKHCITADGTKEGLLTVNRQFPGPNIQVCQNDIIVVDVVNRVAGQSFGVHWRGQSQKETPFMDGVPMVTQCPIPSFTTFQYKFRASHPGTHMWQVNTGEENLSTLFGGFIVRRPDTREPQKNLYDTDEPGHVVTIHTWGAQRRQPWLHDPVGLPIKLLINGKAQVQDVPAAVFHVTTEKRHRFRVLFGGQPGACHVVLSLQQHQLLVIALDGHSITPKLVTSVRIAQGERVDIVVRADQPLSTYSLQVTPAENCAAMLQPVSAQVLYQGYDGSPAQYLSHPHTSRTPPFTELATVQDRETCTSTESKAYLCLSSLTNLKPLPQDISSPQPDSTVYLFYGHSVIPSHNLTNTTFIAIDSDVRIPHANNLTMVLPPSPLLSQSSELNRDLLCSGDQVPHRCTSDASKGICECVHTLDITLGSLVDLVLVNKDTDGKGHLFHLHGQSFYVLGLGPIHSTSLDTVLALHQTGSLLTKNLASPILKDTVHVPAQGAALLRFKADNPGYWLLAEEQATHWTRGMNVILHVGKTSDMPATPSDFPRCGNWIGPEFFLV